MSILAKTFSIFICSCGLHLYYPFCAGSIYASETMWMACSFTSTVVIADRKNYAQRQSWQVWSYTNQDINSTTVVYLKFYEMIRIWDHADGMQGFINAIRLSAFLTTKRNETGRDGEIQHSPTWMWTFCQLGWTLRSNKVGATHYAMCNLKGWWWPFLSFSVAWSSLMHPF